MGTIKEAKVLLSILGVSALVLGCGTPNATNNAASSDSNNSAVSTQSSSGSTGTNAAQPAQTAVTVPNFTLPTIGGKSVSLQNLLNSKKPIVLNYFASWCPECNQEMPDVFAAYEQFSSKVQFIGVDAISEDSVDGAKSFIKKYRLKYPVVLDNGNQVASEYGLMGHPETVIIAPNGKIVWTYPGEITSVQLDQEIGRVLAQS